MLPPDLPSSSIIWFAAIMLAMCIKHFAADFVLQTNWMARGKERPHDWLVPLGAHAAAHALGTLLIVVALRPALWWLAPIDFFVHACIDKAKASVSRRTGWSTSDARFWWLMGFDQLLHHVTNVGIVTALLLI